MKFKNNGCVETLILIPGWATDYTIFGPNFLNEFSNKYNFIFPEICNLENPKVLPRIIFEFLKTKEIKEINLLGWSMGSFFVLDFINCYADEIKVNNVFLYAIRRKYTVIEIEGIKILLKRHKEAYLIQFFKQSGRDNKIIQKYKDLFSLKFLINGLNYLNLKNTRIVIDENILQKIESLKIVNSKDDKIAFFIDYPDIPKHKKITEIFLEEAGHLCNIQF